jgi:hypothetical protein
MKRLTPTVIALGHDRYSIVLTDSACGDPKHDSDCGGDDGKGYTAEELHPILAERYCLSPAKIKELIASARR